MSSAVPHVDANDGGKWYALGSNGCMDKGDKVGMAQPRNMPFGVTDPNLRSDFGEFTSFPSVAMGAAGVWRDNVANNGYPGLESVMRGVAMTDFPGFSPQDKAEQIANWQQLTAANLAARAARGDPAALKAIQQTRVDLGQGILSDQPTIYEQRAVPEGNYDLMSQMPLHHQQRLLDKAMSLGACVPTSKGTEAWSLNVFDHIAGDMHNNIKAGNSGVVPAFYYVADDGNVLIQKAHMYDPAHMEMAGYPAHAHVQHALENRRVCMHEGQAVGIEYPFSHHFVGSVMVEMKKEVEKIKSEERSAHVRKSMLPGTASTALEPAVGHAGRLLKSNEAYAQIASEMRTVSKHLASQEPEKAQASLADLARGVSEFFAGAGRKVESAFSPANTFSSVADLTFGVRGSSTTRRAGPQSVREAAPRHMTALWVGRQKAAEGQHVGPYANGTEPNEFFVSKISEFLHGMDSPISKAKIIASSLQTNLQTNFSQMGFHDLGKYISAQKGTLPALSMKPVVLDVHNADAAWGRNKGLQTLLTPGHIAEDKSALSVFDQVAARNGIALPSRMATGYQLDSNGPAMTIVGFHARANQDLTMTNSQGKEVPVPRGTRLFSGAMLVRADGKLTQYDMQTHNPGVLHEGDGVSDFKGEVFRFWDPHHEQKQGGFAIASEATVPDRNSNGNNESTRAGSMFFVFDE